MFEFTEHSKGIIYEWLFEYNNEVVVELKKNKQGQYEIANILSDDNRSSQSCRPSNIEIKQLMMHTHPKSCYIKNDVKYGFPSGTDFKTILENDLREHFVLSLEGMYYIHCPSESSKKYKAKSSKEKKQIIAEHDFPGDVGSIHSFLKKVNSFGYITCILIPHGHF
jgi:hypothetical protein